MAARSRAEARPEVLFNVLNSIHSQAIDSISRDKVLDPRIEGGAYASVFSLDIRKGDVGVTEPAFDDRVRVGVVDGTVRVEFISRVERIKLTVVNTLGRHICAIVVYHNVDHEVHAAVMKFR